MGSLPAISGKEAVRRLERLGFSVDRVEGSHHVLTKSGHPRSVVVPVHGPQALPKGTLASILRQAGVTKKLFFAAVK